MDDLLTRGPVVVSKTVQDQTTRFSRSISVVGLRGRYNERTNFLITTMPSVNEAAPAVLEPVYFPHFVDGGGYTTQFILFSGQAGQFSSGTLQFFSQGGNALNLTSSPGN